jgi:hypothetical protein
MPGYNFGRNIEYLEVFRSFFFQFIEENSGIYFIEDATTPFQILLSHPKFRLYYR